ncbi:hypothetical protein [Nitrincola lacisaponensis]|uniref:hypothetical protein n=1 Tax=Nitrincola lacisaponensis TaxID=267850 RepID=UPI000566E34E|nr:hypothetical protein [Nitrincola lacisaponensis]
MINDPNIRKSIYASVIASLLVILFIQPILNYSAQFFIWTGDVIYNGFSKRLYEEAALGLREKYSFIISSYLLSIPIVFCIIVIFTILYVNRKRNGESDRGNRNFIFRKIYVTIAVNLVILFICTFYIMSMNFAGFQMNASFNQRMMAIKPYVSDREYDELRSLWARMRSRDDYIAINNNIDNVADKENIFIPEVLWK